VKLVKALPSPVDPSPNPTPSSPPSITVKWSRWKWRTKRDGRVVRCVKAPSTVRFDRVAFRRSQCQVPGDVGDSGKHPSLVES
jgi:hypothetical protein